MSHPRATDRPIVKPWVAIALLLAVAASLPASLAHAQSAVEPAAENARLRQRVAALETEVERLRAENRRLAELAGLVPEEDMVEVEAANIVTKTDPETGVTTTATRWVKLPIAAGDRSDHQMLVRMADGGQAQLIVATHFSRRIYQSLREVRFTIDGNEVACPVLDYGKSKRGGAGPRSGALYDEVLTIDMGRDLLDRIAGARNVGLQMRHVRAELAREQLAQFKALAARGEDGSALPPR